MTPTHLMTLLTRIIDQYYRDYQQTEVITHSEFDELVELLGIIFDGLDEESPGREDITSVLKPRVIDLDLSANPKDPAIHSKLESLRHRQLVGDQRSEQWLQERVKYITASICAACAGLMGQATRTNQLLEKASGGTYRTFFGGYYTDIGNIFEPITNMYYCHVNNTQIYDFGLIPNDTQPYDFLGASTDGVATSNGQGRELVNIEIKTLPGRVPNGKVKKEYYHQMQQQMFCLGLEQSDFLEAKYKELDQLVVQNDKPIGIIIELWSNDGFEYEYSPIGISLDKLKQWADTREQILKNSSSLLFLRWIYWTQTHYSCINVKRDPKWIVEIGPLLKQFYDEVQELKANPKKLAQMIRDREVKAHTKKSMGNPLFSDCMI